MEKAQDCGSESLGKPGFKEDDTQVVLSADKGVAMVVMDKSAHVDKCMTLLQDTNVCQPCRD